MRIHKEGTKIIIMLILILMGINTLLYFLFYNYWISSLIGFGTLILLILLLRFFRHPDRSIEPDLKKIVSPADGTVVIIKETFEKELLQEKRIQVSIFMSIHDVHVNRYPISGKVIYYKYHEGKYLIAKHPKSSEKNERTSVVIETIEKKTILVRQIAGIVARRIICYASESKQVQQGDELGFIRFGSRVDLFLPLNTKIEVKLGNKVKGNLTLIGNLR